MATRTDKALFATAVTTLVSMIGILAYILVVVCTPVPGALASHGYYHGTTAWECSHPKNPAHRVCVSDAGVIAWPHATTTAR